MRNELWYDEQVKVLVVEGGNAALFINPTSTVEIRF